MTQTVLDPPAIAPRGLIYDYQRAQVALHKLDAARQELVKHEALEPMQAILADLDDTMRRAIARHLQVAQKSHRRGRALRQLVKALHNLKAVSAAQQQRWELQKSMTAQYAGICEGHKTTLRALARGSVWSFLKWRSWQRSTLHG